MSKWSEHTYKPLPNMPPRKATPEQLVIRRWFGRLDIEVRCALIRQTHGMSSKASAAVFRQAWIDDGRPG